MPLESFILFATIYIKHKNTLKHQHTREVLKDEEVKSCLADLHSKFIKTPIDKANENVALFVGFTMFRQ